MKKISLVENDHNLYLYKVCEEMQTRGISSWLIPQFVSWWVIKWNVTSKNLKAIKSKRRPGIMP